MSSKTIRAVVSLAMLVLAIFMLVSGLVLFFTPSGYGRHGGAGLPFEKHTLKLVHAYVGFVLTGLAVVHVYLNRRPLLSYLGLS